MTVASSCLELPPCAHIVGLVLIEETDDFEVTPGSSALDGKEGKCTNTLMAFHHGSMSYWLRGLWYSSWRSRRAAHWDTISEPSRDLVTVAEQWAPDGARGTGRCRDSPRVAAASSTRAIAAGALHGR